MTSKLVGVGKMQHKFKYVARKETFVLKISKFIIILLCEPTSKHTY